MSLQKLSFLILSIFIFVIFTIFGISLIYFEKKESKSRIELFKKEALKKQKEVLKLKAQNFEQNIKIQRKYIATGQKDNLKKALLQRFNWIQTYYKKIKSSKSLAISNIKDILKKLSFLEKDKNYFILSSKGDIILDTLDEELEGKNHFFLKDVYGKKIIQNLIKTAKDEKNRNGVFFHYKWFNNDVQPIVQYKTNFIKYFEPLDIIIGAGYFKNSIEKQLTKILKQEIIKHLELEKVFSKYYKINFFHLPYGAKKFATLKVAKNIKSKKNDSKLIISMLKKMNYNDGQTFLKKDDILYNGIFLSDYKYFFYVGVDLKILKKPLKEEIQKINTHFKQKITILMFSLVAIIISLLILFYIVVFKMEKIFNSYEKNVKNIKNKGKK